MIISKIHIEEIATYTQEGGVDIEDIAEINFFYGTNGSGKTTISKILADRNRFTDCDYIGGEDHIIQVYKEDFKNSEVFVSEIKGVFTLGSESKEVEDEISIKSKEIESLKSRIEGFVSTKESKNAELIELDGLFKNRCWEIKTDLESNENLKDAFKGVRNDKTAFSKKVLEENDGNTSSLLTYTVLIQKAERIFGEKPETVKIPTVYDCSTIKAVCENPILKESISGKEDSEISKLITELKNSDWVKAGIVHLGNCHDTCPFCQSSIDVENLQDTLKNYFDESYETQINELHALKNNLELEKNKFIDYKAGILKIENPVIDTSKLKSALTVLESSITSNINAIQRKIESPSQSIELTNIESEVQDFTALISNTIIECKAHNKTVENFDEENKALIGEVWKYTVNKLNQSIMHYNSTKASIASAIEGISKGISNGNTRIASLQNEISTLETKINSLKPTISEINITLQNFGFHSFTIEEKEDRPGYYSIVRTDRSDANATLSEGEKTFISFLYFYYRINGVLQGEDVGKKKIIVIDDPISSLDSNVVFVVSSMIKKLLKNVSDQDSYISQVFVLTHNIYFHKEVSYEGHGIPTANRKYWLVRKSSGVSSIEYHEQNPVSSSYQMMWKEIDDAKPLTICNILRRILETYFQHYGDTQLDNLPDSFLGDEKLICRSLISWIQDGSHNIMDDLYCSLGDETVEKYKEVFRKIFEQKGQIAHYNMMIGQTS